MNELDKSGQDVGGSLRNKSNQAKAKKKQTKTQEGPLCVCVTQSCPIVCVPMDCSLPASSVHENSPGENTGVGCHALLQGIFPTKGSIPRLLQCRRILYHLNHQGYPWILEWVVYPFPRDRPNPGIELGSSALQVDSLPAETRETQGLLWVPLVTEGWHTLDLQNWRRKVGIPCMYIMSLKWRTANRFEYQLCHTTELALGSILHNS